MGKFNLNTEEFTNNQKEIKKEVSKENKSKSKVEEKSSEQITKEIQVVDKKPDKFDNIFQKRTKETKTNRSVYLELSVINELERVSSEYGLSFSEVANKLLKDSLFGN